ncbi:uncharacterized protein LOC135366251 [Ornithodoros turicata]|uniref:uncharacterized protein LOC135366251 n=1 Tax=Ornithodoros turicata TaxID=34597 RepID=UPI00313A259C
MAEWSVLLSLLFLVEVVFAGPGNADTDEASTTPILDAKLLTEDNARVQEQKAASEARAGSAFKCVDPFLEVPGKQLTSLTMQTRSAQSYLELGHFPFPRLSQRTHAREKGTASGQGSPIKRDPPERTLHSGSPNLRLATWNFAVVHPTSTMISTSAILIAVLVAVQGVLADPIVPINSKSDESSTSVIAKARTFLPSLLTLPALAAPVMLLGASFVLLNFMPTVIPAVLSLISLRTKLAPLLSLVGLREAIDLENMEKQLESVDVLERGLDYLDVKQECRQKAACELGEWFSRKHPALGRLIDAFGDHVLRISKYGDSLLLGGKEGGCEQHFPTCTKSPLRKYVAFF